MNERERERDRELRGGRWGWDDQARGRDDPPPDGPWASRGRPGMDDRFRDDEYYRSNRWDYHDDRRGDPEYRRDESPYEQRFGRGRGRGGYDRGEYDRDNYDRDYYNRTRGAYDRDNYGRGGYGRDSHGRDRYDDDPYDQDRANWDAYNRDPYGRPPNDRDHYDDPYRSTRSPYDPDHPYPRNRSDPYGDAPGAYSRDSKSMMDTPAVVDYGHSRPGRGDT